MWGARGWRGASALCEAPRAQRRSWPRRDRQYVCMCAAGMGRGPSVCRDSCARLRTPQHAAAGATREGQAGRRGGRDGVEYIVSQGKWNPRPTSAQLRPLPRAGTAHKVLTVPDTQRRPFLLGRRPSRRAHLASSRTSRRVSPKTPLCSGHAAQPAVAARGRRVREWRVVGHHVSVTACDESCFDHPSILDDIKLPSNDPA